MEKQKKAKLAEFTAKNGLEVADYYEYSMAQANLKENYFGLNTVFDLVLRNLPKTKVIGQFERNGVKYDELTQRSYMINAGLEQAVAILSEVKGNKELRSYFEDTMHIEDEEFLDFVENVEFKGDAYAMKEGELFFGQESQMRVHETFEVSQLYETLLITSMNPQTNIATTANDIASVVNEKVLLLEGGSRRATSQQGAAINSRAAIIGGFHAGSNVAYGTLENVIVGGTHGHSYVMLHPTEYISFKAQVKQFGNKACFLLDTYDVESALEKAIQIAKEENLDHFAFRVDSGDLGKQYFDITERLEKEGFSRDQYTMFASDDLNAGKIADLENRGAHFDKYLVGTFLVSSPKPLGGVYELAAYIDKEGNLHNKGKFSENPRKATLPGIKQIYRISDREGMFQRDVIAIEGEDISDYVQTNETYEHLFEKVMENGEQIYNPPTVSEISNYRKERLSRLPEVYKSGQEGYPVIVSEGIQNEIEKVRLQVEKEKLQTIEVVE